MCFLAPPHPLRILRRRELPRRRDSASSIRPTVPAPLILKLSPPVLAGRVDQGGPADRATAAMSRPLVLAAQVEDKDLAVDPATSKTLAGLADLIRAPREAFPVARAIARPS